MNPIEKYQEALEGLKLQENEVPEVIKHLIVEFTQQFDLSKADITGKGKTVISEIKNVLYAYETESHDGCDDLGPKSYLWSVFVFHIVDNKIMVSHYHWENWFQPTHRTDTYRLYDESKEYDEWKKHNYYFSEFKNSYTPRENHWY